jgi:hypothetical protein
MRPRFAVLAALCLALATLPAFFEIYRSAAFVTTPRTNYAGDLLALAAGVELSLEAPSSFRVLSLAPALVPFELVGPYVFSRLPPDTDLGYLRAVQSLALVSYLSLLGTSILQYAIARRRLGASIPSSIAVCLATWIMAGFLGLAGVDATAVLWISVLVWMLHSPRWFVPLVLASAAANEKVAIVFFVLLFARAVSRCEHWRAIRWQLAGSAGALLLYVGARLLLGPHGSFVPDDAAAALAAIGSTVTGISTPRGILLNAIPVGLVLGLHGLARAAAPGPEHRLYFTRVDFAPVVVLVVLAILAGVQFNIGRIAMHAFPLSLPLGALYLDRRLGPRAVADPFVPDSC